MRNARQTMYRACKVASYLLLAVHSASIHADIYLTWELLDEIFQLQQALLVTSEHIIRVDSLVIHW